MGAYYNCQLQISQKMKSSSSWCLKYTLIQWMLNGVPANLWSARSPVEHNHFPDRNGYWSQVSHNPVWLECLHQLRKSICNLSKSITFPLIARTTLNLSYKYLHFGWRVFVWISNWNSNSPPLFLSSSSTRFYWHLLFPSYWRSSW